MFLLNTFFFFFFLLMMMESVPPNLTLKFFLITLFSLILLSSSLGSTRAMHIVSWRFFPLRKTGSPLKILSSWILAGESWIAELSSFKASSTFELKFQKE